MLVEFTDEKPSTPEMRLWLTENAEVYGWKLGGLETRNGLWKQRRKVVGVHLSEEDAVIFKLKYGL
jgi:hypothetical protein